MVQALRVVCREELGPTLARELAADLNKAIAWLDKHYIYTEEQLQQLEGSLPNHEKGIREAKFHLRGKC